MSAPIEIIRTSILNCQACAEKGIPPEDVAAFVCREMPAGTENNWQIELEGRLKPVQCGMDENRVHYVFTC